MKVYKNNLKVYICPKCGQEVVSLLCWVIDPSKPDTPENWMELCSDCLESKEVKIV